MAERCSGPLHIFKDGSHYVTGLFPTKGSFRTMGQIGRPRLLPTSPPMKRRTSSVNLPRPALRDLAGGGPSTIPRSIPVFNPVINSGDDRLPRRSAGPSYCPSTDHLVDQYLIPGYLKVSAAAAMLPKTRKCTRLCSLEMELFGLPTLEDNPEDFSPDPEDFYEYPVEETSMGSFRGRNHPHVATGVLRRVNVPENFSVAHVEALTRLVLSPEAIHRLMKSICQLCHGLAFSNAISYLLGPIPVCGINLSLSSAQRLGSLARCRAPGRLHV